MHNRVWPAAHLPAYSSARKSNPSCGDGRAKEAANSAGMVEPASFCCPHAGMTILDGLFNQVVVILKSGNGGRARLTFSGFQNAVLGVSHSRSIPIHPSKSVCASGRLQINKNTLGAILFGPPLSGGIYYV